MLQQRVNYEKWVEETKVSEQILLIHLTDATIMNR